MLRKLLIILLLYLLPGVLTAQIMVGAKVGANFASQFKSDFTVPKPGLMFGGAVMVPIVSGISVQGEFLITQKGYREYYKGKEVFDQLTATYMEIPALARYSIDRVNWGYSFHGGVAWSYWSAGKYQSSIDGSNIIVEDYQFQQGYDNDGYKDNRNDFSLVVGAGVTYDNLGSGILAFDLRYTHGLVPTNNYQNPPADVVNKLNKTLTLSITYFLFL